MTQWSTFDYYARVNQFEYYQGVRRCPWLVLTVGTTKDIAFNEQTCRLVLLEMFGVGKVNVMPSKNCRYLSIRVTGSHDCYVPKCIYLLYAIYNP